jgi:uroporphyrinogen decarboxylase
MMTSKERMLAAITGTGPDRLPVTTHHVMPYFLQKCLPGTSERQFWDDFGFDAITWCVPHIPAPGPPDYPDPLQASIGFLESRRFANDSWRVFSEDVSRDGHRLTRYRFVTPGGTKRT